MEQIIQYWHWTFGGAVQIEDEYVQYEITWGKVSHTGTWQFLSGKRRELVGNEGGGGQEDTARERST